LKTVRSWEFGVRSKKFMAKGARRKGKKLGTQMNADFQDFKRQRNYWTQMNTDSHRLKDSRQSWNYFRVNFQRLYLCSSVFICVPLNLELRS
jgi:hypothetical protein